MWVDDNQIETVLTLLWRASWQAALLTGLVLFLQLIFKKHLTARWRYNLWLVVLLRVLLPVLPQSPLSIYTLFATKPPTPATVETVTPSQLPFAEMIDDELPLATELTPTPEPPPHQITTGTIGSAPPPPPAAQPFLWRQALLAIWLLGLLLFLTRIFIATLKLHRLTRRFNHIGDPHVLTLLDACKRDLRVRHHVTILSSDEILAPALMGFLKPKVLLPAHLLIGFDPRELRLVLMHELAHVRRCDVLVNWLATLLHALHWFNPVLWLALNRMRTDRELATDELVLLAATRPDDRHLYGQTILKLLQQTLSRRTVLPGMVGILEGTHPLRRRITMIAQFKEKKPWSALALVALVALCAVTLTDPVRGQDAADDEKKDATTATTTEEPVTATERRSPARERTDSDRGAAAVDPRNPQDLVDRQRERRARELDRDTDSRPGRGGGRLTTTADPRRTTVTEKPREEMDAGMRAQFDRKLPEVNFNDVPFVEVIEFLRDVSGANIFVNWRALEAAGIERNAPVSMRMKSVSFATVLRLLLDSTAPGLLRFDVEGGVIIITTSPNAHDQLAPQMMGMGAAAPAAPAQSITRVYDVRGLVAAAASTASDPNAPADPVLSDLRRQRAQLAESHGPEHVQIRELDARIRGMEKHLASTRVHDSQLTDLVSIVQSTIGQDQPLSVRGFKTKLIVRAAPEVQREVEQLLTMLREDNTADTPTRKISAPSPVAR
jgi:beta-lactamase regulating signal transducer with metallopeptidase domain